VGSGSSIKAAEPYHSYISKANAPPAMAGSLCSNGRVAAMVGVVKM
jgi:hypothetical protein